MYGFSVENLPTFLIGRELLQICVGANDIILNFDDRVRILISTKLPFVNDNEDFLKNSYKDDVKIFGCKLSGMTIKNGKLLIQFENETILQLTDDSENYESIVFYCNDKVVVA